MTVRLVFFATAGLSFDGEEFASWKAAISSQIKKCPPLISPVGVCGDCVHDLAHELASVGTGQGIVLTDDGSVPAIQLNVADPERPHAGYWLGIHAGSPGQFDREVETKRYDTADLPKAGRDGFFAITEPSRDEQRVRSQPKALAL